MIRLFPGESITPIDDLTRDAIRHDTAAGFVKAIRGTPIPERDQCRQARWPWPLLCFLAGICSGYLIAHL